jgi:hypothetical protein
MRISRLILAVLFVGGSAYAQDVFDGCGLAGDATDPEAVQLNPQKNRHVTPHTSDFDSAITLDAMLQPGKDAGRWSTAKAAEFTGYVFNVKAGGVETCNCHAHDAEHRDTHIELTLNDSPENTAPSRRVIVEVSPRLRRAMHNRGVDWSTASLQTALLHHWIKVQGWMFFDAEHKGAAENTHPNGMANWRATCWELHPVTSIQVVNAPSSTGPKRSRFHRHAAGANG